MQTTRDRTLAELQRRPGVTVEQLAGRLELSPMAVRHHLARLSGDGLVEASSERRRVGRPAHAYRLTPKGEELFPKAYAWLAGLLWDELIPPDGTADAGDPAEEQRAALLRRLAESAAAPHLAGLRTLDGQDRARVAARLMQRQSASTEVEERDGYIEVRDYNCIFEGLLPGRHAICDFHVEYARRLMGVEVELRDCRRNDAEVCCFRAAIAQPEAEETVTTPVPESFRRAIIPQDDPSPA